MKIKFYLVFLLLVFIVSLGILYAIFKETSLEEREYPYSVEGFEIKFGFKFSDINEELAKNVSEQAILNYNGADYRFECLEFASAKKGSDERDGKEFWAVGFSCNEECSKKYINCGAAVIIRENYQVIVGFPD